MQGELMAKNNTATKTVESGEDVKKKSSFRAPPRRRIRRKPGTTMVKYFTQDTQDAIVRWQKEKDQKTKDEIYTKEISYALNTLAENLINVYGFKTLHDSKEELKAECVQFLYTTLHKFNADKGSKAFSYFNVVAKNWLTIKSKQNTKRIQQHISIDDRDNISISDLETIEKKDFVAPFEEYNPKIAKMELQDIVDYIKTKAKTEDELLVLDSLEEIINNLDDLEIITRRSVLLYLREISKLNQKQLSAAMSTIRKSYAEYKTYKKNMEEEEINSYGRTQQQFIEEYLSKPEPKK